LRGNNARHSFAANSNNELQHKELSTAKMYMGENVEIGQIFRRFGTECSDDGVPLFVAISRA